MIEQKWTPGPWAVVQAKESTDGGFDHAVIAAVAGKSTVIVEAFQVVGDGIEVSSKANANLIAAAPELYAALSAMVEIGGNDDGKDVFKIARAALKKARG